MVSSLKAKPCQFSSIQLRYTVRALKFRRLLGTWSDPSHDWGQNQLVGSVCLFIYLF